MAKLIDMTGWKMWEHNVPESRWTVIKRVENASDGSAQWLCECNCEKHTQKILVASKIRKGQPKSCGCLQREKVSKLNYKDIKGQTFGELTVIEETNERDKNGGGIIWKCKCSCGKDVYINGVNLRRTSGNTLSCKECANKKNGEKFQKDILGQTFGELTVIEKMEERSNNREIIWKCKCSCGNYCEVPGSILRFGKKKACSICLKKESQGENTIKNILIKNNISFTQEQKFNSCRFLDTNALARFDFYVNNKYLIEYDGIQHFEYGNTGWNTKDTFIKTKEHDIYKTNWCNENNIPLIRIPYTHLKNLCIEDLQLETTKWRVV